MTEKNYKSQVSEEGKSAIKQELITRRTLMQALGASLFFGFATQQVDAASTPPNFSFVFVCDTHLVTGQPDVNLKMLQESQIFLQESIKQINALKPDFVIFGGDQVETPGQNDKNWELFVDLAQGISCPWYFVLGEQDCSGKMPVDKMRTYGPDFKGKGIKGDTPYWSYDPIAGVHIVGLDTGSPNSSIGELGEEQLNWLKSDLSSNKNKFTIVASHHPLLAPPPYDGGPPWDEYVLPNGADAREILAMNSDVRMVVSGHLYLNKVQLENNVYHISCAGMDVYPCQFKHFSVTKAGITMQSYGVPFPALVKKANKALTTSTIAIKYNRQKSDAILNLCEGEDQDQNAFMSFGTNKGIRPLSKKELKEQEKLLEEQSQKGQPSGKEKEKEKEKTKGKEKEKRSDSQPAESSDKKAKKGAESNKKQEVPSSPTENKTSKKSAQDGKDVAAPATPIQDDSSSLPSVSEPPTGK